MHARVMLGLEGETVMNWSRLFFWRSSKASSTFTDDEIERYRSEFPEAASFFRRVSLFVLYYFLVCSLVLYYYLMEWLSSALHPYLWWHFPFREAAAWVKDRWTDSWSGGVLTLIAVAVWLAALLIVIQYYAMRKPLRLLGYAGRNGASRGVGCGIVTLLVLSYVLMPGGASLMNHGHDALGAVLILTPWELLVGVGFVLNVALGRMCERAGGLCRSNPLAQEGRQAAVNFLIMFADTVLLTAILVRQAWKEYDYPALRVLVLGLFAFAVYCYGHLFLVLRSAARVLDKAAKGEKVA